MTETTQEKLNAYTSHQRNNEADGREIDKRALLNCASRLREALDGHGSDMKAYAAAIHHNQRLWTMFQVALCDPENLLPRDLKITLLNLSRYVDRVSFRAITAFAPQLLTSLIDINRTIATGLSKKQAAGQAQASMTAEPVASSASIMTSA
jgi:flagellar protein FlaF